MSVAVMQTAFLGDMILTTPLIQQLAARDDVHVVATPANAGILANHPAVASVIVFDKREADRGLRGAWRVAEKLRATGAHTAYLAQGSVRTAMIARLARIVNRVGFDTSPGRIFCTRRVPFDASLHHAQRLWQLGSPAGVAESPPPLRPTLYPDARDVAQVDALLSSYGVTAHETLIALAPGSVWATKRWPSYAALVTTLIERTVLDTLDAPFRFVVIGAAVDAPLATAIAAAVAACGGRPVIDATGQLSLLASAALLSRARVLITNDSAPMHLASAMNTPTIALFGPTVPAFGFGPLADVRRVVEHLTLPCRPCGAHGPQQCPLGHWDCMREVSAQTVADVLRPLVQP